jgi:hypothetical protein
VPHHNLWREPQHFVTVLLLADICYNQQVLLQQEREAREQDQQD